MTQYAFLVNSDACSGCKTCQVACQDRHDLPAGIHWRIVYEVTGGDWRREEDTWISTVAAYNLSVSCHHCMDPSCLPACFAQAIWKRSDGIVLIDESLCNRCHKCEAACPYGAIRYDLTANLVAKCHFCVDLLDAGLAPSCVAACPNRALDFGDYDELSRKYGGLHRIFPLPETDGNRPALVIIPHRNAVLVQGRDPRVANSEEL